MHKAVGPGSAVTAPSAPATSVDEEPSADSYWARTRANNQRGATAPRTRVAEVARPPAGPSPSEQSPDRSAPDPTTSDAAAPAKKAGRRWTYRALIAAGAALVLAVGALQLSITLWSNHSARVGGQLVHQFLHDRGRSTASTLPPGTAVLASCGAAAPAGQAQGVILIPRLGVTAPVLQGTDDAELNVGVGHDPNSVWPGSNGNAVLDAHDVSYFQNLPELSTGDTVLYDAPCTTYTFEVLSHAVVAQGSPVYNTPGPSMTLVTCWPTDALWFTPDRYLVSLGEVSAVPAGQSPPRFSVASAAPNVPVPAALAQQGVTLDTFSVPMGTLALGGAPSVAWSQTTNPLLVEESAVEAFIAGLRSLEENHLDWWRAVAPQATPPAPLVGAQARFEASLDVTVDASGTTPTGVTLTDTILTTGGSAPGLYKMTVTETVALGTLTIAAWTVSAR